MPVYFAAGCDYVQLGSAFMMTNENNLPHEIKEYIALKKHTDLTNVITGKWARGVENTLMKTISDSDIYDFPAGHYSTAKLRAYAKKTLNPEYVSLYAGSNTDNLIIKPLDDPITELQVSYDNVLIK